MKKILALLLIFSLGVSLLASCNSNKYKDGVWEVVSEPDERGDYGALKLTIKDGKITAADWQDMTKDGPKDENYGKTEPQEYYDKAQEALKASKTFAEKLVQTQDVEKIDGISGATNSYKLFKQLVEKALENAKK